MTRINTMAFFDKNSTGRRGNLTRLMRLVAWLFLGLSVLQLAGCASVPERRKDIGVSVILPFMRMDSGECYYLDDFMPTPDNMVSGKSSGLHLRYYTFRSATYKTWESERVMLAFYSRDNRCWSLFEEYSTSRF